MRKQILLCATQRCGGRNVSCSLPDLCPMKDRWVSNGLEKEVSTLQCKIITHSNLFSLLDRSTLICNSPLYNFRDLPHHARHDIFIVLPLPLENAFCSLYKGHFIYLTVNVFVVIKTLVRGKVFCLPNSRNLLQECFAQRENISFAPYVYRDLARKRAK